ncbi:hypothetical protein ACFLV7_14045 [Chloroflexota bacterium]
MAKKPDFDLTAAHKYFSAHCFNEAWNLIDKPSRTPEEGEEMIRLSLASTWHWKQRDDCTQENLSASFWQTSRIYSILEQVDIARKYARLCLDASQGEDVAQFYLGYAYEALARAESLVGDTQADQYLKKARNIAAAMSDSDEKQMLLDDLATIG